jgi:hypothetical protein
MMMRALFITAVQDFFLEMKGAAMTLPESNSTAHHDDEQEKTTGPKTTLR